MTPNETPEIIPPTKSDVHAETYRDQFVTDDDYAQMLADAPNWGE